LLGLAVRSEWLGVVIVLAVTPIAFGWPKPLSRPLQWKRVAVVLIAGSLWWGVEMEGIFAVLDNDEFQPLGALLAAGIFGVLSVGLCGVIACVVAVRKRRA
jgi:hypothetical protein